MMEINIIHLASTAEQLVNWVVPNSPLVATLLIRYVRLKRHKENLQITGKKLNSLHVSEWDGTVPTWMEYQAKLESRD